MTDNLTINETEVENLYVWLFRTDIIICGIIFINILILLYIFYNIQ